MPIPDVPRVIYDKNPLEFVIFQVRFPSVLRIDSELPADFQEQVRKQYPLYNENRGADNVLPREVAKLLEADLPLRLGRASYEFTSEDGLWQLSLTRDFLALTCKKYERWEDFKAHLVLPLRVLEQVYSPSFCSRVGLRYRDVIVRSSLGLTDAPWSALLKPYIAGELSSPDLSPAEVQHVASEIVVRLSPEQQVRVLHGLAITDTNESAYVIDSDYSTDKKVDTSHVIPILDAFNLHARRLFRWCINDRLHDAMGPRLV